MGRWADILDANVGARDPARHVGALRFPKLGGWEPGRVWAAWPVEPDFLTPAGTVFGGYLAALADHTLACALFTMLEDDEVMLTTDLQTNFLRPVPGGVLGIEARVVSRGRRTAYCEVRFTDGSGELVARAGATQMILARRGAGE